MPVEAGQVDTSITANIGKNTWSQFGDMAKTMNAINENRLFMGRKLAGESLQQSIDPNTGQVDYATLNKLISANPRIAPYAQEALWEALTAQGQNISNTTAQTNLAKAYADNLRTDLASTKDAGEAATIVARGVAAGRYPASFATSFLGGGDTGGGYSRSDWEATRRQATMANGSDAEIEQLAGKPQIVNTGGTQEFVNVNRFTGTADKMGGTAAELPNTMTPEAAGAMVDYTDSSGVTHSVPRSAVMTPTAQPKPNVPGLTDERGAITTSLPPGEVKSREIVATAAADQSQELMRQAEQSMPRQTLLNELLATQGDFRSGPGAAKWSGIVTEANRVFGTHFADDDASAQQVFGKLAQQVAAQQRAAMGSAATNAQSEAAALASPNSNTRQKQIGA